MRSYQTSSIAIILPQASSFSSNLLSSIADGLGNPLLRSRGKESSLRAIRAVGCCILADIIPKEVNSTQSFLMKNFRRSSMSSVSSNNEIEHICKVVTRNESPLQRVSLQDDTA